MIPGGNSSKNPGGVTHFIKMDFPIHIDTMSMGLSILYF